MAMDMTPQRGANTINIPITFDYSGGRASNRKGKIILSIVLVVVMLIVEAGVATNKGFELYQKIIFMAVFFYVMLAVMRYFVFSEQYFSDIYETLKAEDYNLKYDYLWQIFTIDDEYPYICYYRNGYKGIFVRMEKDAITGKGDDNVFSHYEALGDAYNICHSLNMNMIHIDYMDNVGNDERMEQLDRDLMFVKNDDMRDMLIDIYEHLKVEMSRNYASFDIYVFLTRGDTKNFVYNVQTVAGSMLSGNFITYKIMDKYDILKVCTALFNLHSFRYSDACAEVLGETEDMGITPIYVKHQDGSVDELNKTREQKRLDSEIRAQNAEAAKRAEKLERRMRRRRKDKSGSSDDDEIDFM